MKKKIINKDNASFRDPAGYIYYEGTKIYRKVNKSYIKTFDYFVSSGLYEELLKKDLIIKHKIIERTGEYIILEVEKIPFISYPYEWCFEELRDAAIITLNINLIALKYGMILKDASAYNVQFINSKVIFIDTLSFDIYKEGSPWGAYGQFSRHFIAPLLLMNCVDERMNLMLRDFIDGIPLDLAEVILKKRGGMFAREHIMWQNKAIKKHNKDGNKEKGIKINLSKKSLINIIAMLQKQILELKRKKDETEWESYYDNTNYSSSGDEEKQKIILKYVSKIKSKNDKIIDIGANDGKYSRLVNKCFSNVISVDIDSNAVNKNYEAAKKNNDNILPLVFDFNNPTPAIGFACQERSDFKNRSNVKLVLALALIHHMAISNNVPFRKISKWLSKIGEYLIIEFVPKTDSQVELLLKTRKDIFENYTEKDFEEAFCENYTIIEKNTISTSQRILYLMVRK